MARKLLAADLSALRTLLDRFLSGERLPAADQAAACRTTCRLLAEEFPGRHVELRVPPWAAVQLGIGERGAHTRGTPPAVVETDPGTLLSMATGTTTWQEAIDRHLVRASGVHADLSAAFPVLGLRRRI